jgi:hypothetical protein
MAAERTLVSSADAGLCASCRHVQLVPSAGESIFYLCRLSFTDPRFAKYPRLPVIACTGYAPGTGEASAD